MPLSKEEILLQTRKKLFLDLHGEHESIFGGHGLDFKEVREYNSNDDIRHLNWKITARTGTPSINLYNETKQLSVLLVYLNSAGLCFGTPKRKQETATEALTALSYAAIHYQDTLRTLFYSHAQQHWHKPGIQKGLVDLNFETANDLDPLGHCIYLSDLSQLLLQKIKRRSLIFLIGDFLDFDTQSDLGRLASQHELYCVIIRDKAEERLSASGEQTIIDPLTEQTHTLTIDRHSALRYNTLMQAHDNILYQHLHLHHINYQKIYTHDNTVDKLRLLVRR